MGKLRKLARGTHGSEIAEAALVIPIFFMILLGIYWFGRAFNTYATINHAAREGALAATMYTCASCATPNQQTPASSVATTVTTALQAAGLNSSQIQVYSPPSPTFCGGAAPSCNSASNNITVCSNVQLTPTTTPGPAVCGVTVSFGYPYVFSLPTPIPPFGSNGFNLLLKATVQMRGEY